MLYNGINSLPDIRFGTIPVTQSASSASMRQDNSQNLASISQTSDFFLHSSSSPREIANSIFGVPRLQEWKEQGFELSANSMQDLVIQWQKQQDAKDLISQKVTEKYPDHEAKFASFINSRDIIGQHQPIPDWLEQELKADEARMPQAAQDAFARGKTVYVELTAIVENQLKKAELQDEKNEIDLFQQALNKASEDAALVGKSAIEKDEDVEINADV